MIAFSLANCNNFPSDLVRMKTSALRCSYTVNSSAARKRVNKVGAKALVDPTIGTAPANHHEILELC